MGGPFLAPDSSAFLWGVVAGNTQRTARVLSGEGGGAQVRCRVVCADADTALALTPLWATYHISARHARSRPPWAPLSRHLASTACTVTRLVSFVAFPALVPPGKPTAAGALATGPPCVRPVMPRWARGLAWRMPYQPGFEVVVRRAALVPLGAFRPAFVGRIF